MPSVRSSDHRLMPDSRFLVFDYLVLPSNGFLRFLLSIFSSVLSIWTSFDDNLWPLLSTRSVGFLFSVAPFNPFRDYFFRFILSDHWIGPCGSRLWTFPRWWRDITPISLGCEAGSFMMDGECELCPPGAYTDVAVSSLLWIYYFRTCRCNDIVWAARWPVISLIFTPILLNLPLCLGPTFRLQPMRDRPLSGSHLVA